MSWGQERSTRRRAALLGFLAIVPLLSGCSSQVGNDFAPPGAFNRINEVVDELALDDIGAVTFDARYGTTFPSETTYYIALIEGPDSLDGVQKQLAAGGFDAGGSVGDPEGEDWERGSGDEYARVFVRELQAGEKVSVDTRGEDIVSVEQSGALVKVSS